jgi:hypothetical protein
MSDIDIPQAMNYLCRTGFIHEKRAIDKIIEALHLAREYIMSGAEKRNYDPPVPSEIVTAIDTALSYAKDAP